MPCMIALGLFATYLVLTIGVGIWASRRNSDSQEDYFLGGRSSSAFAMALSAVSSGRSAWLVLGASGAAWSSGLSAFWLFPGYILAEAWMFTSIGPRLRLRSIACGALTIPEVFERSVLGPNGRGSSRLPLRSLAGLVIVLFLWTYISAQLVAGGKTLGAIFPSLDGQTWGLVLTAGIVLVYTWLGGYRAVVVTDVVQACLMLVGIALLPLLGLIEVGGISALKEQLLAVDPTLMQFGAEPLIILGGFCIGLGSLGNPHILVRHMSLEDPNTARTARRVGTTWNILMAAGALGLGLVGRALYPEASLLGEGGREMLFPVMAADLSSTYLFAGFVGFLLATLFAAIMSTCDSQLLVIASSLIRDLGPRRDAGHDGGLLAGRLAVLGTLSGAVWLTFGESPLIHNLVLLSWFALGVGLGPVLLLVLFDERTTARGACAGILTGVLGIVGVWFFFLRESGGHVSWEAALVFLLSLGVTFALRSRDPRPSGHA
ncbi:MAG: SSS family solute:Na+ symporter [Candidatus Paceibacteria bacterium]|jgi:SSS family solute:Na+ symporter